MSDLRCTESSVYCVPAGPEQMYLPVSCSVTLSILSTVCIWRDEAGSAPPSFLQVTADPLGRRQGRSTDAPIEAVIRSGSVFSPNPAP